MNRRRRHERHGFAPLDRDVAPPALQSAFRQLDVPRDDVGDIIVALDLFDRMSQRAQVRFEVANLHRHDTGVSPLYVAVNLSPNSIELRRVWDFADLPDSSRYISMKSSGLCTESAWISGMPTNAATCCAIS